MKAMLMKTEKGLHGATDTDHAAFEKLRRRMKAMKPGQWLRLEWSSPRNGKHHRKLFALLRLIEENSETYNTTEKALVAVKLCVGHFDLMVDPQTGEIQKVPRSISFESMGQEEFDIFYSQAIDAVLQYILPQMDRETADELLEMIIGGWA